MDFVLLEPPTDPARYRVGSITGEKPVVQFNECIAKQGPLCRVNCRDIAPNSVSECHS
jgi:hypothetical protein